MVWATTYTQNLDPLGNRLLSTLFAALPVLVLFYLLVPRRWLAPKAGAAGAVVAILVAWLVYDMPLAMASMAFVHGASFGLMPVGWTVFNAMLIYNITVETGQFAVVRRSVASLSADARIQAILIGFAFGAFLEGAAGSGAPVAVCGAMLVGLGFKPFLAAVLCLIANTSPVAYGGLGTPVMTLGGVTGLPDQAISVMAGRQLPFLSCIVPLYMVKCMCTWRQTREVWPALAVGGGSFATFQYFFASAHLYVPGLVVFHMTDVGGGIFALIVTAIFLRFWKPPNEWHFTPAPAAANEPPPPPRDALDAEARAETEAILAAPAPEEKATAEAPLTVRSVCKAWMAFALMSVCLMLTGFLRQLESKGPVSAGLVRLHDGAARSIASVQTSYAVPIPTLHEEVERAERLHEKGRDPREKAEFIFNWLSSAGTPVFFAAVLSALLLRMTVAEVKRVVRRTVIQMRVPIPTIACMLGLSYVTRYAGMDATLGIAFAETGVLYPFFAAMLGWLGVFLTGTDAGSNALFGSLQKITATELFNNRHTFSHLHLDQAQVLICTANSTGGVMGKMIDAQSICVATAGTNQVGREADIFKAVIRHSILLAAIVGGITLLQAYLWPFTLMVPRALP